MRSTATRLAGAYLSLMVFFLLGSAAGPLGATVFPDNGPPVRYDSSAVVVRRPAPDHLAAYRSDPDFIYDRDAETALTWWDRFRMWLRDQVFGTLQRWRLERALRWFIYLLAALGIVYAVMRLLRMDRASVLYGRHEHDPVIVETVDEDISEIDFDRLIEQAVAARAYRRAVRLHYLKVLKALAERELIAWHLDKTNHDYVEELGRPELRSEFARLTHLFEYVWYGDVEVEEEQFGHVRDAFIRFEQRLVDGTMR